ncbi:hypothetical protein D3C81_1051570 [compost metagenome]
MQDVGAGNGFDGDDQHPEPPVQPADGKAGPRADGFGGIGGERAAVGVGDGHFAEHAHHQQYQQAGHGVGDEDGRASGGDGVGGTDEQTRADDAGDGDHGHLTGSQAVLQGTLFLVVLRSHEEPSNGSPPRGRLKSLEQNSCKSVVLVVLVVKTPVAVMPSSSHDRL